jgi:DNA-binding PadR family transcriptional regulator
MLSLNYAILKYFTTVSEADADTVMDNLKDTYSSFRAFKKKSIFEALNTAEKNEILEESRYDLDSQGALRIFYRLTSDGRKMIDRFIA